MVQDLVNGYVTSETHKGITTIEFFHPQSNSLPRRLLEDLANEIHAAGADAEIALRLRGFGQPTTAKCGKSSMPSRTDRGPLSR